MKAKKLIASNITLTSLVIIMILFTFILSNSDLLNNREKMIQNEYYHYLNNKFDLINEISISDAQRNTLCLQEKSDTISIRQGNMKYSFHCELIKIFVGKEPTKKYIYFKNIEDYLNIKKFEDRIIRINSISDLPISSINNPQIVILTEDISGKLDKDFYGIIITDHLFELKYGAKFYGVLYSSYSNDSNRYITYQSSVIESIKSRYSYWQYLSSSKNILSYEKTD